jgi:hypothetical protein
MVPVTVSGTVSDMGARITSVQYNVHDRETNTTTGNLPVTLDSNGHYSFTVDLQARRSGRDKTGRQYTIDILASDSALASSTDSAMVIVPHDRGHGIFVPPGPSGVTVTSPPATPPTSPSPSSPVIISNPGNSGEHGNQGDQGGEGDQSDQGDQGDQGGGPGNGHGNDNGNGHGNGHNKGGGD